MNLETLQNLKSKVKYSPLIKAVFWGVIVALLFSYIPSSNVSGGGTWNSFEPVFAVVTTILRGKFGPALLIAASGCFIVDTAKSYIPMI